MPDLTDTMRAEDIERLVSEFLCDFGPELLEYIDKRVTEYAKHVGRGPITASTIRARILYELGPIVRHHE